MVGVFDNKQAAFAARTHFSDISYLHGGTNTLKKSIIKNRDLIGPLAAIASLSLIFGAMTTNANDASCVFEATLSNGADASYTFSGEQGGLVLSLGESGYEGIRFLGSSTDHTKRTMMVWTFNEPLPFGGKGPTTTTINASMTSTIESQSFGSRDMLSGKQLPPLQVSITEREPLSSRDPNAVRMAGTIDGNVSVRKLPKPSITASVTVRFEGLFTFRPPGPYTLNCDNVSFKAADIAGFRTKPVNNRNPLL
ncbi:hypothetical protein CWI75_16630 [Kineobactrum sediminis]|uniref:Uncharacterized protein n=1 Tax=Kineobactrum sediminis TaxID=1905677 RepID=A0A2N5XYP4_9GAMM|nr:hypothetical protein [Kineobactrum sediminis]PLW81253.1 hypothetical protein CWI75_16630 [Kineobactrum sediminis]